MSTLQSGALCTRLHCATAAMPPSMPLLGFHRVQFLLQIRCRGGLAMRRDPVQGWHGPCSGRRDEIVVDRLRLRHSGPTNPATEL